MSEKVVALPGYSIPTPQGEPVPEIVMVLEDLLQRANSGGMRAFAFSWVEDAPSERMTFDGWRVTVGTSDSLIAATSRLLWRMARNSVGD